jgi:hypothetical protein
MVYKRNISGGNLRIQGQMHFSILALKVATTITMHDEFCKVLTQHNNALSELSQHNDWAG